MKIVSGPPVDTKRPRSNWIGAVRQHSVLVGSAREPPRVDALWVLRSQRNRALSLVLDYEHDAAIELRTRLVTPRARRDQSRLTVADRRQLVVRHTLRRQIRLPRLGPTARESKIVARRTRRIREAFDRHLRARIVLLNYLRKLVEAGMVFVANLVAVEREGHRKRELKPCLNRPDL